MLKNTLHRIVSHPSVYNLVQTAAGFEFSRRRLAKQVRPLHSAGFILDIGGGTGIWRRLWPADKSYICLDIDRQKLQGVTRKYRNDMPLLGDATELPIATDSVDVIMCTAVSHHLSDTSFDRLIAESARVLKPTGTFIFLDAVWEPKRWAGRLLWKYDRGSYPHEAGYLLAAISTYYQVTHSEEYAIYHKYLLCIGKKRSIM